MQKADSGVGDVESGLEAPEMRLARERPDESVASRGTRQVDALQTIAKLQIGRANVGDCLRPAGLEPSQSSQVWDRRQTAVSDLTAADFELQKLRHARQALQTFVGERVRCEAEARDLIEAAELLCRGVRDAADI